MSPATQSAYRGLASFFYKTRLTGTRTTTTQLLDALAKAAPEYRPAYFRRLKNALAFDLSERGFPRSAEKIRQLRNPVTKRGSGLPTKKKADRLRSFSEDDFLALSERLVQCGFDDEFAAVALIKYTGARPAELRDITVEDGVIVIPGAKKSHNGSRGAGRNLIVNEEAVLWIIKQAISLLRNSDRSIGAMRDRLRKEARAIWPRRKQVPTMYSMRHQFGANLKASNLDASTIAYIMGHQSTASVEGYGDKRQGVASAVTVCAAPDACFAHIRVRSPIQKVKKKHKSSSQPAEGAFRR